MGQKKWQFRNINANVSQLLQGVGAARSYVSHETNAMVSLVTPVILGKQLKGTQKWQLQQTNNPRRRPHADNKE